MSGEYDDFKLGAPDDNLECECGREVDIRKKLKYDHNTLRLHECPLTTAVPKNGAPPLLPRESVHVVATAMAAPARPTMIKPVIEVVPSTEAVLVRFSDVKPEAIRWLWPGRIPHGKLTLIDGDPGLGKSILTVDVAARITVGKCWPNNEGQPGPGIVMMVSAEDDLADTILPRFLAAGGDPKKAVFFSGLHEKDKNGRVRLRTLNLQLHVGELEDAIRKTGAVYVCIDPLTAYLGRTDSKTDAEVRGVLAPLAEVAGRTDAAHVAVMHLNKKLGGPAVYRPGGSIAFIGAARMGHLVTADPEDRTSSRRLFLPLKENLAAPARGLAYRLEPTTIMVDDGTTIETVKAVWEVGAVTMTAQQALDSTPGQASPQESSALDEAKDVLREILKDGQVSAKDVEREARAAGVKDITIRRARLSLGVQTNRQGFGKAGEWYWTLPKQASDTPAVKPPSIQAIDDQKPIDAQRDQVGKASICGANDHLLPSAVAENGLVNGVYCSV